MRPQNSRNVDILSRFLLTLDDAHKVERLATKLADGERGSDLLREPFDEFRLSWCMHISREYEDFEARVRGAKVLDFDWLVASRTKNDLGWEASADGEPRRRWRSSVWRGGNDGGRRVLHSHSRGKATKGAKCPDTKEGESMMCCRDVNGCIYSKGSAGGLASPSKSAVLAFTENPAAYHLSKAIKSFANCSRSNSYCQDQLAPTMPRFARVRRSYTHCGQQRQV